MALIISTKVHGDIRHLESPDHGQFAPCTVHGDIRHLEIKLLSEKDMRIVHGDIRHLESFDLMRWASLNAVIGQTLTTGLIAE